MGGERNERRAARAARRAHLLRRARRAGEDRFDLRDAGAGGGGREPARQPDREPHERVRIADPDRRARRHPHAGGVGGLRVHGVAERLVGELAEERELLDREVHREAGRRREDAEQEHEGHKQ